eukprot:1626171-Prymnesium_polylepis.1
MNGGEQRNAACDGYRAILHSAQLSPNAEAANLGLRCDPVQARVYHAHRVSLVYLLARRSAAGEPTLLVCHCAPLRCHCECLVERISEMARLLYEYAMTVHVARVAATSTALRIQLRNDTARTAFSEIAVNIHGAHPDREVILRTTRDVVRHPLQGTPHMRHRPLCVGVCVDSRNTKENKHIEQA